MFLVSLGGCSVKGRGVGDAVEQWCGIVVLKVPWLKASPAITALLRHCQRFDRILHHDEKQGAYMVSVSRRLAISTG